MKKLISIFTILTLIIVFLLTGNCYAATLDAIDIELDKTTVRPGEEVKVTINFGQELGAYTFNVAYDKDIFEYVSVDGGTGNDTSDKVKVTFHDETGGSNPRSNMSITFRAKSDITTSNPTEFTVTGEGLANADASVTYDDITTPIVKNVTVEPEYKDYKLTLEHTGEIIKDKEHAMTLAYASTMGKYYEHARLVAEATTPDGASVKLLATDEAGLEHDIIQSGWGDAQGFKIGGKDVKQELETRATFSHAGEYNITLKLIDRDDSDKVISQENFKFTVLEKETAKPEADKGENVPDKTDKNDKEETGADKNDKGETGADKKEDEIVTPSGLPKTGDNIYMPSILMLAALVGSYIYVSKKH